MKLYIRGYHWPHLVFFSLTPIVAIVGGFWILHQGGPHWATWVLTIIMLFTASMSITGGYHRLFSHKSYQATWPVRLFFLLFGAAGFEGSARWWSCEHRYHHRYVDTELDPYGINKGFWYAHIGWLLKDGHTPPSFKNVSDLDQDPLIRFQDRFFMPIAVIVGFLLPTAIASLWGDPWGGFIFAGVARMVFNHHATFCINSFCHYIGKQTYSDKHTARDSWVAALITYGEGYHNFHHEFQYDYRNGIRVYHWDPTKWLIQLFAATGLASHLKTARQERILLAKLEMDQKRCASRFSHYSDTARAKFYELLASAQEQIKNAHARFQSLKQEYKKLKRDKMASMTASLEDLRLEMNKARRDFRQAMAQWRILIKGPLPSASAS